MVKNNFIQMDYKIIQLFISSNVFIGLVRMIGIVKLNRGNLKECQMKALKIRILQS